MQWHLSHQSARDYLRLIGTADEILHRKSDRPISIHIPVEASTRTALSEGNRFRVAGIDAFVPCALLGSAAKPSSSFSNHGNTLLPSLHISVYNKSLRLAKGGIVSHVRTIHPPLHLLIRDSAGLVLSGPELSFAEMGCALSIHQLIEYGMELCGAYCRNPENGTLLTRKPITTPDRIARALEAVPRMHGVKPARMTAPYLVANVASPMEAKLVSILVTPYRWGGYGLPLPQCNLRIDLNQSFRRSYKSAFYVGDLVWPEKRLIVEYDSDAHHLSGKKAGSDAERRNALERMGWTVVTITTAQLYDVHAMDRAVETIAPRLGKRVRHRGGNWIGAQAELRRALLFG